MQYGNAMQLSLGVICTTLSCPKPYGRVIYCSGYLFIIFKPRK